jgi:hypothetical protein
MFHVKLFGPVEAKNLTRLKQRPGFEIVRSLDLFVQSESGGGGTSMEKAVSGGHPGCKIR